MQYHPHDAAPIQVPTGGTFSMRVFQLALLYRNDVLSRCHMLGSWLRYSGLKAR